MPEAENEEFPENQLAETLETAVSGRLPAQEAEPQGDAPAEDGANADEAPAEPVPSGPGPIKRAFHWLLAWHPLFFLTIALGLLAVAWRVYPEPEQQHIPPARELYNEGLDRLYRVMNPDLPLRAATPVDEALAARSALLNLFIFHRGNLKSYPDFIDPHLLLAEAEFRIGQNSPGLAEKHFADAFEAYRDALAWETRDDDARRMAIYVKHNFLGSDPDAPADNDVDGLTDYLANHELEIGIRQRRRAEYIRYRMAECDIRLGRPEEALPVLEEAARDLRVRRREDLRGVIAGESAPVRARTQAFELGADEYARLPLLLAMTYDRLGQLDKARPEYNAYLASGGREGRDRVFVLGRLARIAMEDGAQYRGVDAEIAGKAFADAAAFYDEIAADPDSPREARDAAVLGSARAYSARAGLAPGVEKTVVDEISDAGAKLGSWLEAFSGRRLPQRTLAIPSALGAGLGAVETAAPGPFALSGLVAGRVAAMAGGGVETAYSRRWDLLKSAIARYDNIAAANPQTPLGARASIMAARESWNLGLGGEAEFRFKTLLDPLSSPEINLAARLGLAGIALERGDFSEAGMLVLGGRSHAAPLWLTRDDADWRKFAARLGNPASRAEPGIWARIWDTITPEGREAAAYAASGRRLDDTLVDRFLKSLNFALRQKTFYDPAAFADIEANADLAYLLAKDPELLVPQEIVWRNRLLLEAALPYEIVHKASRGNLVFEPFPPAGDLDPEGLTPPAAVAGILIRLARGWSARAAAAPDPGERMRLFLESATAYLAAMDSYRADPGEFLPELAAVYEGQAEAREAQGNHREALALTAKAGRTYLSLSSRARGAPREMESLLAAADAFFRSGLLERAIESLGIFLERYGYTAPPGSETAMSVARAENLLGRSYWFLDANDRARESFARNIKRRTPERYKSIYYIGRVMMDQALSTGGDPALLGDPANPMPRLDRDGDPIIESALQAFNFVKQDPGINPSARAWRWSSFDGASLAYVMAERARREAETKTAATPPASPPAAASAGGAKPPAPSWLPLYDNARRLLSEALERYPLRSNGGPGLSVRVEPEDYADLMASRFEAEYLLANTLIRLADAREDDSLAALARAHLANLADTARYADALFDPSLDRFQLNAAVIREAVEGGNWDTGTPLPRTRLGDDEGPTHSPARLRELLKNATLLLADEYYRAAERLAAREDGRTAAAGLYRQSYDVYQSLYDRFGPAYGPLAMLGMADALNRLGQADAAANHYRMAENIARMQDPKTKADGLLDIGPDFWGKQAAGRLRDQTDGYRVP